MARKPKNSPLIDALRQLLQRKHASSQEYLCADLKKMGYLVNQTKVSRLLRQIGAVKVVNSEGQTVYSLPHEPAPPSMETKIGDLIRDIVCNESLVIIFTSPGSASMVARVLDFQPVQTEILGTIAGDDTIFVAPKTVQNIKKLTQEIRNVFCKS